MPICSYCGKRFNMDRHSEKLFPVNAHIFCSKFCLRSHIERLTPLSDEELVELGVVDARNYINKEARECLSIELKTRFRSILEVCLAEGMVECWPDVDIYYEANAIAFSATKHYVPDFWLPKFGVWLEAKGEWLIGGKKKFERALRVLGNDRLLLFPPHYKKFFKRDKRVL